MINGDHYRDDNGGSVSCLSMKELLSNDVRGTFSAGARASLFVNGRWPTRRLDSEAHVNRSFIVYLLPFYFLCDTLNDN
jgi:hypothetical protein